MSTSSNKPDPREKVAIPLNEIPCPICGAKPRLKTHSIERHGITFRLMVYPCDCYDKQEREKEEKDRWQSLLIKAKIPPRYQAATLDPTGWSPYEKKIIPICRKFIDIGIYLPKGLGLIGDVGVGKTYYLCAIMLSLMKQGQHCIFLNVPEYYDSLKATFSERISAEYEKLLDLAKDTPVVSFDDIGAEYNSQWAIDELGKIINHRYNFNRTTLFTSNLRADELAQRIGPRTVDRLKEMTRVYLIKGKSLRGKK